MPKAIRFLEPIALLCLIPGILMIARALFSQDPASGQAPALLATLVFMVCGAGVLAGAHGAWMRLPFAISAITVGVLVMMESRGFWAWSGFLLFVALCQSRLAHHARGVAPLSGR